MQYRILTARLEHIRGIGLCHPLHFWLGRFFLWLPLPLGEQAHRVNLLSAVGGAIGVAVAAAVVLKLTRNRIAAGAAALAVMLAHMYWLNSVETEVLSLSAALMALEWYALLAFVQQRRPALLVLLFAFNGLHVADHQFGLLTLATYGVVMVTLVWRRNIGFRWVWASGLAWAIAASPYWLLIVQESLRTGRVVAAISSALFGGNDTGPSWAADVLNTRVTWSQLKMFVLAIGYDFPSLVLPVAFVGLFRGVRRRERVFRWVLIAQTLIFTIFIARYAVVDAVTFMPPLCLIAGVWYGLGVDRLWRGRRDERMVPHRTWSGRGARRRILTVVLAVNVLLPLGIYIVFPRVAEQRGLMRAQLRPVPYRDNYAYFFQPWRQNDRSAKDFARAVLDATDPGGWVMGESSTAYIVAYMYMVHGGPPGIRINTESTCLNVAGWPRVSADDLAAFLRDGGEALAIPSSKIDLFWGERFLIDKQDEQFWRIRLRGGVQNDGNPLDSKQPMIEVP